MKLGKRLRKAFEKGKEHIWRISVCGVVLLAVVLITPSLFLLIRTRVQIGRLNKERNRYVESMWQDSLLIERLKNDEFLEQYARERYFMQRPKEQVFIVE